MSGFVALLQRDGAPVDRTLLGRMTAAQRFRGPDGEAQWADGAVGLGHTLHRTTLEAAGEVQPLSLDGRVYVTADARIDARAELCAQLAGCGIEARRDASDAELILHAYAAWGTAAVEHLLGDFSFVLWDGPHRRLLCAVDALGVKPLCYVDRGGLFAAANSVACLRLHPAARDVLDERAVGDFLLWGSYLDRDASIFEDVRRLPPGHRLVVDVHGARVERYFTLPEPDEVRWRPDECVDAFRELLDAAVRDRLRTPRVAINLSGGLDSTLVAESAKRQLREQFGAAHALEATTVGFGSLLRDDEHHYADLTAQQLELPLRHLTLDEAPLFDDVARLQAAAEPNTELGVGPFVRATIEDSARCPVRLTGVDGDALLLATPSLHWALRIRERRFVELGQELAWYVATQRGLPPIGVRNTLKAWRDARSERRLPPWLRRDFADRLGLSARWQASFRPAAHDHPRAPSRINLQNAAWGGLFNASDAASLGVALELRHPLADLRLIRFAMGLPAVPWCIDKELLRRVGAGRLPEPVRTRPKTPVRGWPAVEQLARTGLGLSYGQWASTALEPYVDPRQLQAYLDTTPRDPGVYCAAHAVGLGLWLARGFPPDPGVLR